MDTTAPAPADLRLRSFRLLATWDSLAVQAASRGAIELHASRSGVQGAVVPIPGLRQTSPRVGHAEPAGVAAVVDVDQRA